MRPGTEVTISSFPGSATLPTDTATAYVIGVSERGPTVPVLIDQNLDQFVNVLGGRLSYSMVYDWVDTFFREGGNRFYFSRAVGDAATVGTLNLVDNAAAVSLVVDAIGPGAWSADYKVGVVAGGAGGTYRIRVTDADNVVLEESDDLYTQQAAVEWSEFSSYIRISLGVSALNPVVAAPTALSAGDDDHTNVGTPELQAAADRFVNDLGPGQIVAPGYTTDAVHAILTSHTADHNRVAVLDPPNTATEATLVASVAGAGGDIDKRFGAMFAPWIVVPGVVDGLTRTVPPSALVCGLIGRNDRALGANTPSAGDNGIPRYVVDLSQQAWDDSTVEDLNGSGVNVIRRMYNGIRVYGWRSMANSVTDKSWIGFNSARLIMVLRTEFTILGNKFQFQEIDGLNGRVIGSFKTQAMALMNRHWLGGELFGDTVEEAYNIDMSGNTLQTMENLELHMTVNVKVSPFAEYIPINIVKREITEVI